VPDGDYAAFVERAAGGPAPGPIVARDGTRLGTHTGVHRFTVGQRKGLGLSSSEPLYVLAVDARDRTVVVGPSQALEEAGAEIGNVNWVAGAPPGSPIRAEVQIRHRHRAAAATITPLPDSRARVMFDHQQRAVTPGQAAVFYRGDEVIGGGWIAGPRH